MFTPLIEKLVRHEDLTTEEASAVMNEVMEGRAPQTALAAILSGLAMKGERPAEIVGFAKTMRAHAVKLASPVGDVFDTCGTGGDRSVSSRCGNADVFEQLGVNITASPAVVERTMSEARIAFFFAPTFHPAMKHAASTRRELGIRTVFNLLGPLTNPAGAARQIV